LETAVRHDIGETLKTLEGTTVVESIEKRTRCEPVYNIEVEGDHVYRVGESGVLVHNSSARIAIEALANRCRAEAESARRRPGTVARLVLAGGREHEGTSSFVPRGGKLHPVIERIYNEDVPKHLKSAFHLKCAETDVMSQALFFVEEKTGCKIETLAQAKAVLDGATIETAKVRSAGDVEHGSAEKPCSSCVWPLAVFNITYVAG
jgi:hypothetical protein